MIQSFAIVFFIIGACVLLQAVPSDKWNGDKRTYR